MRIGRSIVATTVEQQAGAIRPFSVAIPDEALDDLGRRLAATRWPSREIVGDRSQGVQLAAAHEVCRYWANEYDLGRVEARLNALPQFITEIDGVEIHFLHVRSPHEDALPLIMTHGWPGSVIEMLDSIGPLTDPTMYGGTAADAFHLVLPSLPGYGFSGEPVEVGWDLGRTAQAWVELMRRLDYTGFVGQGGDVGAGVTDAMGRLAPEGLLGIHTNLLVPALNDPAALPSDTEQEQRGADRDQDVPDQRQRLLRGAVHPATDHWLRPPGLTGGPRCLDDRPRHRRLLQDLPSLRRRAAIRESDSRPRPRQRHDVLADRHGGVGCAVVLGSLRTGRTRRAEPSAAAAGPSPRRVLHVSRRDLADSAQLGREVLSHPQLLP